MKRYLISIIIAILILSPVLLASCAQKTELEHRITILETKVEQLEKRPLTETDILSALRGKQFWTRMGPLWGGGGWGNLRVSIVVE